MSGVRYECGNMQSQTSCIHSPFRAFAMSVVLYECGNMQSQTSCIHSPFQAFAMGWTPHGTDAARLGTDAARRVGTDAARPRDGRARGRRRKKKHQLSLLRIFLEHNFIFEKTQAYQRARPGPMWHRMHSPWFKDCTI